MFSHNLAKQGQAFKKKKKKNQRAAVKGIMPQKGLKKYLWV